MKKMRESGVINGPAVYTKNEVVTAHDLWQHVPAE